MLSSPIYNYFGKVVAIIVMDRIYKSRVSRFGREEALNNWLANAFLHFLPIFAIFDDFSKRSALACSTLKNHKNLATKMKKSLVPLAFKASSLPNLETRLL
jgi:hypothetical protein